MQVLVVHDQHDALRSMTAALRQAGYDVVACSSSMDALAILDGPEPIAAVVTRIRFPKGQPNGAALVRMARIKRLGIKVVIIGQPEFQIEVRDLGEFLAVGTDLPTLVRTVDRVTGGADRR